MTQRSQLEKVNLKLATLSETHKRIGMRIDYHVTFNMDDEGEALRKALGIAKSTFSRLKRGQKEITLTEILILSEFFKIGVHEVLDSKF